MRYRSSVVGLGQSVAADDELFDLGAAHVVASDVSLGLVIPQRPGNLHALA